MATSSPKAKQAQRVMFFLGVVILALGFLVEVLNQPEAATGQLRVRFLDVGQGDAILIDTPGNHHVLVDGGPDDDVLALLTAFLAPPRDLALVVASHNHADHITGLKAAVAELPTDRVWISGAVHTSNIFSRWLETLESSDADVQSVVVGKRLSLDGVEFRVLHPLESFEGITPDHQHDATVLVKVSYGVTSVLLTGDLEFENEQDLLDHDPGVLNSTVLKVTHQGSNGGSSHEFLDAVAADIAVISVGEGNKFDHPGSGALRRLEQHNLELYRTDTHGTVTCLSNGLDISCLPEHLN